MARYLAVALLLGLVVVINAGMGGNGNGGGSSGDPILTGFDGSTFEFQGLPHAFFNLVSERDHKLNAYFTPAVMFDHNGTYITALGFTFQSHRIAIHVLEDGVLSVKLNDKPLQLVEGENDLSASLADPASGATMTVTWEVFHSGLGQTVTISTPLMTFVAWATAPGTVDEGGLIQPAYLNTRFTLHQPPASNRMDGVLGRTYNQLVSNLMHGTSAPTEPFRLAVEDVAYCRVTGLFDNPVKLHMASSHRLLLDGAKPAIDFPVIAELAPKN